MVDLAANIAAIWAATDHGRAAVCLEECQRQSLPVAGVDLVNRMGEERIEDSVIEAAGELRSVAEGVQPEANGARGEDALAGQVGVQPPGGLVFDGGANVDGPLQVARDASLMHRDGGPDHD